MPVLTTGNKVITTELVARQWWDDAKDWFDDKFGGNSGEGWSGGNGGGGSSSSVRQTPQQAAPTSTKSSNPAPPAHTSSSTRQTNNNNGGGGGGGQQTSSSSNNGAAKGNNASSSNIVAPSTSSTDSKPTTLSPSSSPGIALPAEASQNAVPSGSQPTVIGDQQSRSSGVNPLAIILPILLVIAAAAAAFFICYRKRRRRPDGASVSINSNPPSTADLHAPTSNVPTVGDLSIRSTTAMLIPPGMAQTAGSRPVSTSSSAFGATDPFSSRTAPDAPHSGGQYSSNAGQGVQYGHSTINIVTHSPSNVSVNVNIVGPPMPATANGQHSHGGSTTMPGSEAPNPFGDQTRLGVFPGNRMRDPNLSMDDELASQDPHCGYGPALASSVGHSYLSRSHDDSRSMMSSDTAQTPRSLFFKPEGSSLVMNKALPLPPQHSAIPTLPPTPSSAVLLLADDSSLVPDWLNSDAPLPPPKGPPPPTPPSPASTYVSSRLAGSDNHGGSEPDHVAFVRMAQRAPIETPLMVNAPSLSQRMSHTPTISSQLRRSPSVLTSGSDEDDHRPR